MKNRLKMKNKIYRNVSLLILILSIYSCSAHKKIPYFKNASSETVANKDIVKTKIAINDQLTIVVNSSNPESAMAFNLSTTPTQLNGTTLNMGQSLQTYQVNSKGNIFIPIIGEVHVANLTKEDLEDLIKAKIYPKYLKEEPIVNIRITNFKISVLGEVNKPGSFTITNEKVSILEALAMAGDMTLYGERKNVLLVRELENGATETIRFNLQDKNILQSPNFYLKQNDVLYVQPNRAKSNASAIGSVETLSVSITSVLVSLTSLIVTILK